MPPKTMRLAELNRLTEKGAQVSREPREVVLDGLSAIVEQLEAIASHNADGLQKAMVGLTTVIAQKNDSGLREAIDELTNVIAAKDMKAGAMDLTPLIAALKPREPVNYRFEMIRNQRGDLMAVDAKASEAD